jgi:iron complex outermembrane recepter protein
MIIAAALAIVAPLVAAQPLPAQVEGSSIEGFVEAADGGPLRGAVVAESSTGRTVLTDRDGRFSVAGVATPTTLRVSAMGYAPISVRIPTPAAGGSAPLRITLEASPLALAGIQVTATPSGRDPLAVARPTSQLAGRDLDRSLGGSLAETLAGEPGISVRYNGPAASMPVIRGLTGDRILVLQDGRRVGDLAGSADDHTLTLDPLAAQRVEVVRGPASLLYGTNALGGVINVISGDIPSEIPLRSGWRAGLQSESAFPGATANVRGEVPIGERWAFAVRGGARTAGDARIAEDPLLGTRLENSFHRNRHGAVAVAHVGERLRGGVLLEGYGMRHGVPLPPGEDEHIVLEGRKVGASGRLDFSTGSAVLPELGLRLEATRYSHEEMEDGEVAMAFELGTLSTELRARQGALGRFAEGAWGVSVLARDFAATGEEQLTAPAVSRAIGAFTYQELRIGGGASLQLGGRADRHWIVSRDDPGFGPGTARSFTALSGSGGFSVPLTGSASLGLSAARSFRSPTVEELFSDALHIGTASYEVGDPLLEPELAEGVDAVLRVHAAGWTAELSLFTSRINGFIHFEQRGDTVLQGTQWPVLAYVQDRAAFRGAEAQAEWIALGSLVLGVTGDLVVARLADGSPVPFTPPARLGGTARWQGRAFAAGGGVRHGFAQRRVALEGEAPTDAYTLLDAHLGWRVVLAGHDHLIQLRGENLGNAHYRDAASRIKDFAPNPGRNISLLVRVGI